MPGSLKLKVGLLTIASLFTICATLAFSARWSLSKPSAGQRNLAAAIKVDRVMGKQMAVLSIQMEPLEKVPEFDHEPVKLKGFITANATNASPIHYHWDLPAGIFIVAGDLSGTLTEMNSGDTAEVELEVTGFSREVGKHIILGAKVRIGDDELGQNAMIASRPEDSMEFVAPQMRKYAQETRTKEFKRGRLIK